MSRKIKIVHVEWHDARSISNGWQTRDDVVASSSKGFALIHTVGLLLSRTRHGLTLTISLDPVEDNANHSMFIPRSQVRSVKKLGEIRR